MSRRSGRLLGLALALPAGVLIALFGVYPFLVGVVNGFSEVDFATGALRPAGLENFIAVTTDPEMRAAFGRSVVWTLGNLVLQILLGTAMGMLLNAGLRGQALARALVLVLYVIPAVVVALVFRFMFNDVTGVTNHVLQALGIIEQPLAWLSDPSLMMITLVVVNSWKYAPFFAPIVLAALQAVPRDLYEAVALDGGGARHRFTAVTLPHIVPAVLGGAMLRTVWTAYDFDIPYLLSNGGGPSGSAVTVPLLIRSLAFD